jgi:hypothetical protein
MSYKYEWCDKHGHEYHEDEGCEYCYEIYKIYKEFLEKLESIKNLFRYDWDPLDELIKEYEEKLK